MRDLVSDAMLDALVPTAPFGEIAALLRERYRAWRTRSRCACRRIPRHDTVFAHVISALRES